MMNNEYEKERLGEKWDYLAHYLVKEENKNVEGIKMSKVLFVKANDVQRRSS